MAHLALGSVGGPPTTVNTEFNPVMYQPQPIPQSASKTGPVTTVLVLGAVGVGAYFLLPSFGSVGKSVGEGVGGIGKGIGEAAGGLGKGVGEGIEDVGEGIGGAVKGIVGGVVDAGKDVGGALKKPIQASKEAGKKVGEAVRNFGENTLGPVFKGIGGLFKKKK